MPIEYLFTRNGSTTDQDCDNLALNYTGSRPMNFQRLISLVFGLFLVLTFAPAAQAQASIYGSVALSAFGFSSNGDSIRSKSDSASLIGGAFYNFPIHSRLTAGIDGRVLYGPGSNGGTAAGVALRIGFVPHHVRLRPYFEIGGGIVTSVSNPGFDPQRSTNGAATFLGGLDVRLTDSVDIRAVELGATAGSSNTSTDSSVAFLDAGVVYHFHRSATRHHP